MTTTDLLGQRNQVLAGKPTLKWISCALILGAISFNAILCFINTRGIPVSNVHVIISEIIIILLASLACRNSFKRIYVLLIVQMILYTVTLAILRRVNLPTSSIDLKISRDLLIPIVFFLLGKSVNDVKAADTIVFAATGLLLFFAAFEYFFLDTFLRVFAVADYYIARGTLKFSASALEISNGLMASGIRPPEQGRTLLPFLGPHRVSSLFLEPSTLGNFAAFVTLWAIIRSRMERKLYFCSAIGGLLLLILSDTRFDAYFLVLATVMLLVPAQIATPSAFLIPFLTIVGLLIFAASEGLAHRQPVIEGFGMQDRLLYSGRVLFDFDIYTWFGANSSRAQTFDSGYGYFISNAGIIGLAVFWVLLMSLRGFSRHFYSFRNITAVYFALLLCISASQFTIKVAALLWFLLGSLSTAKDKDRPLLSN